MSKEPSGNGRRSPRAQEQLDPSSRPGETPGVVELRRAEVDADQGHVEPLAQRAQQLAVAAADLQDRGRAIGRQSLGHPLGAERAGRLALLLAEIVIPAAECPVMPGIGVEPAPFPRRPPAERAPQRLVPGVAWTASAHGIPRPDWESRLRGNHQLHEHRPSLVLGATRSGCTPGRFLRTLGRPGKPCRDPSRSQPAPGSWRGVYESAARRSRQAGGKPENGERLRSSGSQEIAYRLPRPCSHRYGMAMWSGSIVPMWKVLFEEQRSDSSD